MYFWCLSSVIRSFPKLYKKIRDILRFLHEGWTLSKQIRYFLEVFGYFLPNILSTNVPYTFSIPLAWLSPTPYPFRRLLRRLPYRLRQVDLCHFENQESICARVKLRQNGQQKRSTCFAPLLQKELNSDVARFTTHESNLSCNKSGCCKLCEY